jgi:hypothetical protein
MFGYCKDIDRNAVNENPKVILKHQKCSGISCELLEKKMEKVWSN